MPLDRHESIYFPTRLLYQRTELLNIGKATGLGEGNSYFKPGGHCLEMPLGYILPVAEKLVKHILSGAREMSLGVDACCYMIDMFSTILIRIAH